MWRKTLNITFAVAFGFALNVHHITNANILNTTPYNHELVRQIHDEVRELANVEHKWVEDNPHQDYTHQRYFAFLAKVREAQLRDGYPGESEGQFYISSVQEYFNESIRRPRLDRDELLLGIEESQAKVDVVVERYRVDPPPTFKKGAGMRVLTWMWFSYWRIALVCLLLFLVHWRSGRRDYYRWNETGLEKIEEKLEAVPLSAAILYALAWPVTLADFLLAASRHATRSLWMETKLRQAQQSLWKPLTSSARRQVREFVHSRQSIRDKNRELRLSGWSPRHALIPALGVTMLLGIAIPVAQAVTVPLPPVSAVSAVSSDASCVQYGPVANAPPLTKQCLNAALPPIPPALQRIDSLTRQLLSWYQFTVPGPRADEILVVPRYTVV